MNQTRSAPVYLWLVTWVLLFPLLYFTARGQFSIDRAQYNNIAGADAGTETASSSDTIAYRLERVAAYGAILLAVGLSLRNTLRLTKRNAFILSLPLLAMVSMLWSQDRTRSASLGFMVFLLTVFGVYLSQRFRGQNLLTLLNVVGVTATVTSYALVALKPSVGIRSTDGTRAWQGLFVHKNFVGMILIYFFAAAFYTEKRSGLIRIFFYGYMASILFLTVMSQSRTSWLEFIFLFLYLLIEKQYSKAAKMERGLLIATLVAFTLAVALIAVNFGGDIAVAMGKTRDMTGRTGIFEVIFPELWKRPLSGFGYQAFWLGLQGESAVIRMSPGHTRLTNAENGVLQMWLELGATGTIILLGLLIKSLRDAASCLARNPSKPTRWCCSVIFISFLGLINGDKYLYPDTIEWLLFVVAYVTLAEQVRSDKLAVVEEEQLAWAS